MTRRAPWVLAGVIALAFLLTGCETAEWWMDPGNRGWIPKADSYALRGVLALIAIPIVLYAIYKGVYDDRPGGWGGGA